MKRTPDIIINEKITALSNLIDEKERELKILKEKKKILYEELSKYFLEQYTI